MTLSGSLIVTPATDRPFGELPSAIVDLSDIPAPRQAHTYLTRQAPPLPPRIPVSPQPAPSVRKAAGRVRAEAKGFLSSGQVTRLVLFAAILSPVTCLFLHG